MSVSYTHLDVYKRQAAGDQRGSPQTAAYGHCQVTVFFLGKFPDDAVGPVSYTHLFRF